MEVVLTGGKFNRLHEGHLSLLRRARALGDRLVVVLANDANNKRKYAVSAARRKKSVEATGFPDKVVVGDPRNFFKVVEKYRPSFIVLGYDQRLPPGVRAKLDKRIRIVRLKKYGNYSTRKVVKRGKI